MKVIAHINDALAASRTIRPSKSECYTAVYAAINHETGKGHFVLEWFVMHDDITSKHFSIYLSYSFIILFKFSLSVSNINDDIDT